jgi:hypothetical protein
MIPLVITEPNNHDSESWFLFINDSLKEVNLDFSVITIDLNTIEFLDTDDLVVIACLLDSFLNTG